MKKQDEIKIEDGGVVLDSDIISTIILTSDFATLRSMSELIYEACTNSVKQIIVHAIEDARNRLDFDLANASNLSMVIPELIDPITVIQRVEVEDYERLTQELEAGWNEPIDSKVDLTPLGNVGRYRRLAQYNTYPYEMNEMMRVLTSFHQNYLDMNASDKGITEEEAMNIRGSFNLFAMAFSTDIAIVRVKLIKGVDTLMSPAS